jgi:hypothetical protein
MLVGGTVLPFQDYQKEYRPRMTVALAAENQLIGIIQADLFQ